MSACAGICKCIGGDVGSQADEPVASPPVSVRRSNSDSGFPVKLLPEGLLQIVDVLRPKRNVFEVF